jgi:hypothetical protein
MEHFRPLVKGTFPTGYGSDIYNLVPSCKFCNENKGNSDWNEWMADSKNPGITISDDHSKRVEVLKGFQDWGNGKVICIPYIELVGEQKWNEYISKYGELLNFMDDMNQLQKDIRNEVKKRIKTK